MIASAGAEGPSSDAELMRRVAAGERPAFAVLARRHLPRAYSTAYRMLGNAAEAEDVAQEALVRVWERADTFRPEQARFTTWFYRIVANLAIDRIRKVKPAPLEEAEEVADAAPDPLAALEEGRRYQAVQAAVAALPARQRAALVLTYYESLSAEEAGRVLSLSAKAVASLLQRARQTLRTTLRGAL